ncbi:MAG TPA: FAD-dependent oxidoreductase [Thermoanaerobaculia bacterium]|nr:FAD-dependent oxidoreductase [Thermoanaerobaculia bacterium]
MSAPRPDVAVVGAGIVGAACAEALAARGLRVEVFEARFPASGSTGSAMGHLVVLDDSEAQFALSSCSRALWTERAAGLPADVEDVPAGTLWVAADEDEMAHVRSKAAFYAARGVAAEILDGRGLAEAEPNLRPGLAGGLRVPGDRILYPPAAARFLLGSAARNGARLRTEEVVEVGEGFVRSAAGRTDAGAVLVAAGAAAPALLPGLRIVPKKGHLVVTDRAPGFCRHQLIELGYLKSAHGGARESVAFNLQPRATGQMLLGSSRELVGFDGSVNRPLVAWMVARAGAYLPAIAALPALRTWTGFRPATDDNLPFIGRWPALRGVWVAAGHEGLGITTSLGTGALIAALLTDAAPPIDPTPFAPDRGGPDA